MNQSDLDELRSTFDLSDKDSHEEKILRKKDEAWLERIVRKERQDAKRNPS